jgi:hypothetical protein
VSVVLPWLLALAVTLLVVAHVAIAVGLVRERAYVRALVAFFVVPLAPYWAWQAGMRRRFVAWVFGLGLYALGVALA